MEKLLTAAEVAEHLRVSTNWVHSHAEGKRQSVLPSVKLGKFRMFREADVQQFLQLCEALARDQASRGKHGGRHDTIRDYRKRGTFAEEARGRGRNSQAKSGRRPQGLVGALG